MISTITPPQKMVQHFYQNKTTPQEVKIKNF